MANRAISPTPSSPPRCVARCSPASARASSGANLAVGAGNCCFGANKLPMRRASFWACAPRPDAVKKPGPAIRPRGFTLLLRRRAFESGNDAFQHPDELRRFLLRHEVTDAGDEWDALVEWLG